MSFAEALRKLRISRGISQTELSLKLGISKSAISMYECGNREPDFPTLEAIADFFNVNIDSLFERKPNSETTISASEIKFALFGGDAPEITDEMYEDVKRYAQFIKEKYKK